MYSLIETKLKMPTTVVRTASAVLRVGPLRRDDDVNQSKNAHGVFIHIFMWAVASISLAIFDRDCRDVTGSSCVIM